MSSDSTDIDRAALQSATEAFDSIRLLAALPFTPEIFAQLNKCGEAITGIFSVLIEQGKRNVALEGMAAYEKMISYSFSSFPVAVQAIVQELTHDLRAICGTGCLPNNA